MFGGRILCEHMRTCVCFYLSNSSQLRMRLPWVRRPKEEGGSLEKYGSHCGFGPFLLFV